MSREYRTELKALIHGGSGGAWARTERAHRSLTVMAPNGARKPKPGAEHIVPRLERVSGYLLGRSTNGGKRRSRL